MHAERNQAPIAADSPTSLAIEYKSTRLIVGGSLFCLCAAAGIVYYRTNLIAVIVLGAAFLVGLITIKKGLTGSALILSALGIKIHNKRLIPWARVTGFYIHSEIVDGTVEETIYVSTKTSGFEFSLGELEDFNRTGLDRWIRFYRQKGYNL